MTVKKRVKVAEREIWEAGVQTKSTRETYRKCEMDIANESIYDNSMGSSCCLKPGQGRNELGCTERNIGT